MLERDYECFLAMSNLINMPNAYERSKNNSNTHLQMVASLLQVPYSLQFPGVVLESRTSLQFPGVLLESRLSLSQYVLDALAGVFADKTAFSVVSNTPV